MRRPKSGTTRPYIPKPIIGDIFRLPRPTLQEIASFKQLCTVEFGMELTDEEASHFATKTLQLAYVLQPPEMVFPLARLISDVVAESEEDGLDKLVWLFE